MMTCSHSRKMRVSTLPGTLSKLWLAHCFLSFFFKIGTNVAILWNLVLLTYCISSVNQSFTVSPPFFSAMFLSFYAALPI